MMDSLRRRLSKPGARDRWDVDAHLQDSHEVSELPAENTVLLAKAFHPVSNDVDAKEYYRNIIRAAIQHGGVYQGQEISIPWLRMTLAGLEMRPIPPEEMWEGVQTVDISEPPAFADLFPEEKCTS